MWDDQTAHIIDGGPHGKLSRQILPKQRWNSQLRGHVTEADLAQLEKMKSKLYGHINIDKLSNDSKLTAPEKHNLQSLKEKMDGLSSYQDTIK